jgi:hypothetical protein
VEKEVVPSDTYDSTESLKMTTWKHRWLAIYRQQRREEAEVES